MNNDLKIWIVLDFCDCLVLRKTSIVDIYLFASLSYGQPTLNGQGKLDTLQTLNQLCIQLPKRNVDNQKNALKLS